MHGGRRVAHLVRVPVEPLVEKDEPEPPLGEQWLNHRLKGAVTAEAQPQISTVSNDATLHHDPLR